jgi:HSP20 family protein
MAESQPQRWRAFFETDQEVRRLFQELIHQPWGGRGQAESSGRPQRPAPWQPQADMWETDEAVIVEVELPGVAHEDVAVEVEGDILRIAGERRATVERAGRHYYQVERITGHFTRQWRLPHSIDRDAIAAAFKDGVLTLTLLKRSRS